MRDWLFNVFSADCTTLARRRIADLTCKDEYFELRLRGMRDCLCFKSSLDTHEIFRAIAEQLYPRGWHFYEVPETHVDGDVVLDAGCAEGIFPYLCKDRARQIYAFEPSPEFLEGLERSFGQIPHVHIVPAALGSRCEIRYLKDCGASSFVTEDVTDTKVDVLTVDEFCRRNMVAPTYLKADVEGSEIELLRGAEEVIRTCRPKIAITTYHRQGDADEIRRILLRLNPAYHIRVKGIEPCAGEPVMLHAW